MKQVLQAEKLTCHHCGDPCDDEISDGDHHFCCYGCKAVNELLENADLSDHFTTTSLINETSSHINAEKKFGFLDNEDIEKELLHFKEDKFSVVRFHLPAIHCSSCIYLLEHLPKLDKRIIKSEVNFTKHLITITFNNELSTLKEVAVLLSQLGYPPDISLDSLDKTKKHISKSKLGSKIAIAGFCFGNAMLMSMPDYLDNRLDLTDNFKELFGYINIVLSIPLLIYSASDYFLKAWKGLKIGNVNIDVPIALGLLTLTIRSYYEIISTTGAGYIDSLTGLVFFLLIGKWYQSKTYQALSFERDYASYFPVSVTCLVGEEEIERPLKELKKGDVVVLHNDELIPADGVVVDGDGHLDYSFVTGESRLINKSKGQKVFAGGRQKGAELLISLEKEVSTSELTQLWNSDTFKKQKNNLQNLVDRISKYFTIIIILLAIITGVYWSITDPSLIWDSVTAVLIVACPCALALVLPFAYGHGMRLLGKHGFYLKNAEVIEALARVNEVIFDKTGTLTKSGNTVEFIGEDFSDEELKVIKSGVGNSAHPLSRIIHNNLGEIEKLPISSFNEVIGEGFEAIINGDDLKVGKASLVGQKEINKKANESFVYIYLNGYKGYYAIQSSYREGIFKMLKSLKNQFNLKLLSGDNSSEERTLSPYFDELNFNQKPSDKLDFISKGGENKLMIGDGLNDAGALKEASVGIAIAEDIHQFSPACDAILSAEKITSVDKILMFASSIIKIIYGAFILSFLYNLIGLSFAMSGNLTPLISAVLMPISSITVVGMVTLLVVKKHKTLYNNQ